MSTCPGLFDTMTGTGAPDDPFVCVPDLASWAALVGMVTVSIVFLTFALLIIAKKWPQRPE